MLAGACFIKLFSLKIIMNTIEIKREIKTLSNSIINAGESID